jgi:hypothetical protein
MNRLTNSWFILAVILITAMLCISTRIAVFHSGSQSPVLKIIGIDGRPESGANALLLPHREVRLFIFTGDVNPPPFPDTQMFRTDVDGRIALPNSAEKLGMVAFSTDGYAEIPAETLKSGGSIQLRPWSRIHGRLMIGNRPGSGETIMASTMPGPIYSFIRSRTDEHGYFTMERVVPGTVDIMQAFNDDRGDTLSTQGLTVDIAAGEKATVMLGGKGRPVAGRIELPASLSGKLGLHITCAISHFETPPKKPMPDDILNGTAEQRKTWTTAFLKTDAGRAWQLAGATALKAARVYYAQPKPEGLFRIEDVAAGRYDLEVHVTDQNATAATSLEVASAKYPFEVPAMQTGRSDETLTIPPLLTNRVNPNNHLKIGEIVPDFNLPTLDGKTIRLSDFRGKFVLLDNWAVYCTPCIQTMLKIRDETAVLCKSGQLVIIGLNRDDETAKPIEYVHRQHIEWPQAWLGGPSGESSLQTFLSDGTGVWLIGPDGKVLAGDIPAKDVKAVVTAAMKP